MPFLRNGEEIVYSIAMQRRYTYRQYLSVGKQFWVFSNADRVMYVKL